MLVLATGCASTVQFKSDNQNEAIYLSEAKLAKEAVAKIAEAERTGKSTDDVRPKPTRIGRAPVTGELPYRFCGETTELSFVENGNVRVMEVEHAEKDWGHVAWAAAMGFLPGSFIGGAIGLALMFPALVGLTPFLIIGPVVGLGFTVLWTAAFGALGYSECKAPDTIEIRGDDVITTPIEAKARFISSASDLTSPKDSPPQPDEAAESGGTPKPPAESDEENDAPQESEATPKI